MYVVYAASSSAGPSGGSAIGLAFGIAGSLCMIFAGLLAARKKVPVWRLGRAQTWMRGHLWLGLLSLPLILFHGGFRFGGPLTSVLMVLLLIVVLSGIFGAALQHYMPPVMTTRIPMETIYEQIDRVRAQLLDEADKMVEVACGPLNLQNPAPTAGAGSSVATTTIATTDTLPLCTFYSRDMRPFLRQQRAQDAALSNPAKSAGIFEGLRTLLPVALHATVKNLEDICEEERQLRRQIRYHHWLHGWLMVHVPLSLALLLLGCAHAIMALRY